VKRASSRASLPGGSTRRKWILQALSFAVFLFLFSAMHHPWRSWIPYRLFLDLNPLHSLAALAGTRQFVWLALLMIVVGMVWGRLFCAYVCPLGSCIDAVDYALGRTGQRRGAPRRPTDPKTQSPPPETGPRRRTGFLGSWGLQWVLLGCVLIGLALKNSLPLVLDPIGMLTRSFAVVFYPLGVWVANGAIGLLRPLAEQRGWYGLAYHAYLQPGFQAAIGNLILLSAVFMLGLLTRRYWCRSICPLGALLGLLGRLAPARRRVTAACTSCGRCQDVCPMGAIGEDPFETRPSACIQCKSCRAVCPVEAISFSFRPRPGAAHRPIPEGFSRRHFFFGLGLGGMGIVLARLDPRVRKKTDRTLRPPGSLPEEDFLATCVRCGACLRICVTHTLQASGMENGLIQWGTPVHHMRVAGCEQQCNLCGRVCPTGSIRNLPLIERQHAKIGTAVILRETCVAWAKNRLCLLCDEACPYNAIVFRPVEGHKRPFVDESRCNGCGMCEAVCPVTGEAAIVVYPTGEIRLREGSYKQVLNRERIFLEPKEDRLELPEPERTDGAREQGEGLI
jgi:MauM/NapG family ferredoxin protein